MTVQYICRNCANLAEEGKRRCSACLEKDRVYVAARRAQRKADHQCVGAGCDAPAAKGKYSCHAHLEANKLACRALRAAAKKRAVK